VEQELPAIACLMISWKIPKGLLEAVYRRKIDNTMTKRTNSDLENTAKKSP
jgi:hypothetical protein